MTTTTPDLNIISFQEYIDSRAREGTEAEAGAPPYAHHVDGWILRTLEASPLSNALDTAIDTLISAELGRFIAEGVGIDHRSFPELFDLLSDCASKLAIPVPHALTGAYFGMSNAFTAGTDEYSFIFITDGLLKNFKREEARFVIGHECGHIASKHLTYHTLVELLAHNAIRGYGMIQFLLRFGAGLALRAWARRSEVTCDRAGLICCRDLKVAERGLLRLVTGFADADKVDVDDYLRHYREMSDYHAASAYEELFYTHPMIAKRIEALRLFARSELYHQLTGLTPDPALHLLSRAELDRLTDQLVKP